MRGHSVMMLSPLKLPTVVKPVSPEQHLQFPLLFRLLFTRVDITATSAIVALLPAGHFTPPRSGSQREVIVTKPLVAPRSAHCSRHVRLFILVSAALRGLCMARYVANSKRKAYAAPDSDNAQEHSWVCSAPGPRTANICTHGTTLANTTHISQTSQQHHGESRSSSLGLRSW